jgi:hypothetical protein
MIRSEYDDRQFRRGVVLGLTMAEAMLLLIFLLLLLLATKLIADSEAKAAAIAERDAAQEEVAELRQTVKTLQEAAGQEIDITKDWVRIKEELAAAQAEIERQKDIVAMVEATKKAGESLKQAAMRLAEDANIGRDIKAFAQQMAPAESSQNAIESLKADATTGAEIRQSGKDPQNLLASAAQCTTQLQSCKGQNQELSKKLGGTLPSCWVDTKGTIVYLYDAYLKEDGIWIEERPNAGWNAKKAELPLTGFSRSRSYEAGSFSSVGQDLLAWSKQNECRFYVQVFDRTNTQSKDRYKQLLAGVESIFYKRLAQ